MKKSFIAGLTTIGFIWTSTSIALGTCGLCTSYTNWAGPTGGPYVCNGGGSNSQAIGLTCSPHAKNPNGTGANLYGLAGTVNDGVASSAQFNRHLCARTFSRVIARLPKVCDYADPQYWVYSALLGFHTRDNGCFCGSAPYGHSPFMRGIWVSPYYPYGGNHFYAIKVSPNPARCAMYAAQACPL